MKIKVIFLNDQLIDVIGAGIYKIIICKDERERILYIGESVFVLVRCAQHLFELNKNRSILDLRIILLMIQKYC